MITIDSLLQTSSYNGFPETRRILLWLSLPCTGGRSWSYVNLKIPSAASKVMKHVRTLKKLWKVVEQFKGLISREFQVAIEWLQNCRYWKFPRVVKFIDEFSLKSYHVMDACWAPLTMKGLPSRNHGRLPHQCLKLAKNLSSSNVMATTLMFRGEENHGKH